MKLTFKRSGLCGRGTKLHYSVDGGRRNAIDKNAVCEIPSGHHTLDVLMHMPLVKDACAHVDIPEFPATENIRAVVSLSMHWWVPFFMILLLFKPGYEIHIRFERI